MRVLVKVSIPSENPEDDAMMYLYPYITTNRVMMTHLTILLQIIALSDRNHSCGW